MAISGIPRAPKELDVENMGLIRRLMVGDEEYPGRLYDPKCYYRYRTLTQQLHQLGIIEGALDIDAIFLTHKSAVPLADAVRGAYAAAGLDTPHLNYINSNHSSRQRYLQDPQSREEEVARLQESCGVNGKAVIVDQYYYTGDSLTYSYRLLRDAGFEYVGEVSGCWYENAGQARVDLNNMTSNFADELREIGRAAFEASLRPTLELQAH